MGGNYLFNSQINVILRNYILQGMLFLKKSNTTNRRNIKGGVSMIQKGGKYFDMNNAGWSLNIGEGVRTYDERIIFKPPFKKRQKY